MRIERGLWTSGRASSASPVLVVKPSVKRTCSAVRSGGKNCCSPPVANAPKSFLLQATLSFMGNIESRVKSQEWRVKFQPFWSMLIMT